MNLSEYTRKESLGSGMEERSGTPVHLLLGSDVIICGTIFSTSFIQVDVHFLLIYATIRVCKKWLLARAPLRGGVWTPPMRFVWITLKRRRVTPPFLSHLIIHLFHTGCENFRPRSRKVRSPGHVKWPHLIKSLNVPQRYTDWTIALKLSAIATSKCIYNLRISISVT